jgi:16S rRNA (guanine1516-N2)-methyltransferase
MKKQNELKNTANIDNSDFILKLDDDVLYLVKESENSSVCADFTSKKALKRINEPGIVKQDICKAIGFNKSKDISILDATAGLGRDSFIFASLAEKQVLMLERNPTSFALLENALNRLNKIQDSKQLANIAAKLSLENTDAAEYLKSTENMFDVIYLDPMFSQEGQKKSAKVKKEMAFFHETVGNDPDSDILLPLALEKANKRVVVKRHIKAPYLNNQKPSLEFKGKTNRFDVYIK